MKKPNRILEELYQSLPVLKECGAELEAAIGLLADCFQNGGKLLLCGNGGSAADCEHIAGELMKGFLLKRPLPEEQQRAFCEQGERGVLLAKKLQGALPCIPLTGCTSLSTAFANDVDPQLVFAQQVYGYGKTGDALMAISTSGNAANVEAAVRTAKARGLRTVGLTGAGGGKLFGLCDVTIRVPAEETYRVQELHLPVYHALCAALEEEFFGGR